MVKATSLLKHHALRLTDSREEILEIFLKESRALSQREIETTMAHDCDRVTIYRTLSTFVDKGLLHKVLDNTGVTKFALCPSECTERHAHQHDHVHFKCEVCGNTICVKEVQLAIPSLPTGFQTREMNVLLQGTCPECT